VVAYERQNGRDVIIAAKSRVAPVPKRTITIPRLELLSNLIATNLAEYIQAQQGKAEKVTIYSDSQVALGWIKSTEKAREIWVENRVKQIRLLPAEREFCSGVDNPADLASRGTTALKLKTSNWWDAKPTQVRVQKTSCSAVTTVPVRQPWYRSHSTMQSAVRAQATVLRACAIWLKRPFETIPHEVIDVHLYRNRRRVKTLTRKYYWLHATELYQARMELIRTAQQEKYPKCLKTFRGSES
jgi:hypothetical protein